jgi:predicted amidohydrolase
MPINPYQAVAVQSDVTMCDPTDPAAVGRMVKQNLARCMELVDYVQGESRYGPRLMVFPEFGITGVPESRTLEDYTALAQELPGEVTETIGAVARRHSVFIAMNCFERDPEWPGRVFNTSFIIGADGEMILKYRKLNDYQTGGVCTTNPGDLLDAYIERYGGPECLFPVVDTEIGRLACMTCYDVRFAEVARCFALRGAEVILHPTAEGAAERAWRETWEKAKAVRAWENQLYFISANNGTWLNGPRPAFRSRGRSQVIAPDGNLLGITEAPGENLALGTVDIEALRRSRVNRIGFNVPATSRFDVYAPIYAQYQAWPSGTLSQSPATGRAEARELHQRALETLYRNKTFTAPDAGR